MVGRIFLLLVVTLWIGIRPADSPPSHKAHSDRETLRTEWHSCVREAFAARAGSATKASAERAALLACKVAEDAYVAAELAAVQSADQPKGRSFPGRAGDLAASLAAYVVNPVASWFRTIMH